MAMRQRGWQRSMVLGGLAVAAAGCTGITGGTADSGPATTPDAGPAGVNFSFPSCEPVGPDDPATQGGLSLAVSASGEIAVMYFVSLSSVQSCTTNVDTHNVPESELKLAYAPDEATGFSVSSVERTRSADGVSVTYTPSGNMLAWYAGGMNGTGTCASSDLMQAAFNGTTPTITTIAQDGNVGGFMCRIIQNGCNRGNVIGKFPQVLTSAAGNVYGVSQDTHFGFAVQVDFEGSDLEAFVDGTPMTVDDSSGAGNFNVLMLAAGERPAVAHVQIKEHTFDNNLFKPKGLWLAVQEEDGTWTSNHIAETIPTNQIGAAWHPTLGYAVAYQEPTALDLYVSTSVDGVTWAHERVDNLGSVGSTPSVAFSADTLVVAYGQCTSGNDSGTACVPAHDGVRLVWRNGTAWKYATVHNTDEFLEGSDVRMALTASGDPVVAFKSQGTRKVMVCRGRRQ